MHHFIYQGNISEVGVKNAMILMSDSMRSGQDALTLHIASLGGSVTAGMMFYNFLRMMPIPVRTHAVSTCHSIAASVLLGGSIRSGAPASNFMVHAPRYIEGVSAGQVSPNGLLIAKPFEMVAGWTAEEVIERFHADDEFFMTAEDAVMMRVIDEIIELKFHPSEEIFSVKVD